MGQYIAFAANSQTVAVSLVTKVLYKAAAYGS